MTGPEHFAEAERLLKQSHTPSRDRAVPHWLTAEELTAQARVHAALAHVALRVDTADPEAGLLNASAWARVTSP